MSDKVLAFSQPFTHPSILPIKPFVEQDVCVSKDTCIKEAGLRLAEEVCVLSYQLR